MAGPSSNGGSIPLGSLGIEQLERLQSELQREVEALSSSLAQRNEALSRLAASKENARSVSAMKKGDGIMVPLTGSVYVRGEVADATHVLVDVGTGYYVGKTPEDASKFFGRRAAMLKDETDKAMGAHTMKRQQLEAVNAVLQKKVMEARRKKGGSTSS